MENLDLKWIVILVLGLGVLIVISIALFRNKKGKVSATVRHKDTSFSVTTDNTASNGGDAINEAEVAGSNNSVQQNIEGETGVENSKQNKAKLNGEGNQIHQNIGK